MNNGYITVDTNWDYPSYMQEWISAIRAKGKHAWFRGHPNQWENQNGSTGIMTPAMYEAYERNFILSNPSLFQSGDIFDPCSEPENGHYWINTYGTRWTWQPTPPNIATNDFNIFVLQSTAVANQAFQQLGITNVRTNIHSMGGWLAEHPNSYYQSTAAQMGNITIDTYIDSNTTDPTIAANERVAELNLIESMRNLPIIVGEMGYSNTTPVDDMTQEAVLKAEFNSLLPLPYLAGLNYWIGAGTNTSGGYTHIFTGTAGNWSLRPAANDLANFFLLEQAVHATLTPIFTPIPTAIPSEPTPTPTCTPRPPQCQPGSRLGIMCPKPPSNGWCKSIMTATPVLTPVSTISPKGLPNRDYSGIELK